MRKRFSIIFLLCCFLLACHSQVPTPQEKALKEKIGQMLMVGFKGTELHADDAIVQAILKQQIGGVILFDYDFQTKSLNYNIENPKQLKQLNAQLQNYAKQAAKKNKNNLIPLFISIDYEGGKVDRLSVKEGFPPTLSAAAIGQGTYEQANQYAQQMAATLKAEGFNINFAPVVDVNDNPTNPIIGMLERSFSSDPAKVVAYASIFSKASQAQGILCTYKHFPGHGSATGDTHIGFVDVTKTWQPAELIPYQQLLQQPYACPLVITAHVINSRLDSKGYPASLSYAITTDLLRKTLKFNGVVVTDDMQMKAIADHYGLADAIRLAVNAGADILVFGNHLVTTPQDPQEIIDLIYNDIQAGKIPESRIDEAYQRIINLKKKIELTN